MSARNSAPKGLLTPGFQNNQRFDFQLPDEVQEQGESSNGLDNLTDSDENSDEEESEMQIETHSDGVSSVGSLNKFRRKLSKRRNGLLQQPKFEQLINEFDDNDAVLRNVGGKRAYNMVDNETQTYETGFAISEV